MAITPQTTETQLTGTLTSAIDNSSSTPTFTCKFIDKNTGAARTPSAQTQVFVINRGGTTFEIFFGTHSTASGVTTITTVSRGLPKNYSATPLTEVPANKFAHFAGEEVSCVDIATFINILALKLNGTDDFSNSLLFSGKAFSFTGAGVTNWRTFTDATARDAAITAPANGDCCVLTSTNAAQVYYAAAWQTIGTVTSVSDASTTVKGIAEEATQAEIDAGTGAGGTGARLFVNPSTLATSIYNTRLPSAAEKTYLTNLESSGTTVTEIDQALDGISANVTATNLNTLTGGGATTLHSHAANGAADSAFGSGTIGSTGGSPYTFAVTTGFQPKMTEIRVVSTYSPSSSTTNNAEYVFTFDGTTLTSAKLDSQASDTLFSGSSLAPLGTLYMRRDGAPGQNIQLTGVALSTSGTGYTFTMTFTTSGTSNSSIAITGLAYA